MSSARMILPLAVAALLAACSGNLGGGQSTLPGMPQNGTTSTQGYPAPTPTPTPVTASNVATIGDSTSAQALPEVMGFGGTIAFPKPTTTPSPSPNPKATPVAASAPAGSSVSIGITAGVVEPTDAPHFGAIATAKKVAAGAPVGLLFISLLSTADVTLGEYPRIAVDVPRDIAAKYRDRAFALAMFDPETKAKSYRLSVADRDLSSPAPGGSTLATAQPTMAPTMTPSGMPAMGNAALTPPPVGSALGSSALPAEHVAFLGSAATLTLRANRPVVFALYAAPVSPTPSPSPSSHGSATPATPAPGSPSPSPSPSPAPSQFPSSSAWASPSAAPSP